MPLRPETKPALNGRFNLEQVNGAEITQTANQLGQRNGDKSLCIKGAGSQKTEWQLHFVR
jgi:hypothetical protein